GNGTGLHSVPGMTTLKGESVSGYGLYMKSTFDGTAPEKRRVTCEGCGGSEHEWTYIGFHDNARIHTNNQKSLLEAPVIEFFGHAELDAYTQQGTNTRLTLKADSLIFHDSAIFDGNSLELLPYTTVDRGMQHGIVSDDDGKFYRAYGKAITMNDRQMPVLELGYQRCYEPEQGINASPNLNSTAGKESTPLVGGDIIVAFKHAFSMPIFNTIVANHARISFISDSIDKVKGGEYIDACLRTDLLRIRNKVEFYTDPTQPIDRRGTLKMTSSDQMVSVIEAGIYPKHIHTEPGSELSIPGEDSLVVIATTTVGGYGKIHENIMVKANGILAPGFASLMEVDCQSGENQGRFEIHNLKMEDHAILRISMSQQLVYNPDTKKNEWTMTPDTLIVHDSIYMSEKVQLQVLSDFDAFLPGCYLFFIYDDSDDESKEYVKNLSLQTTRYGDYHLALDFSEPGRVYLCVTEYPTPVIQRYIHIHSIEGVTTNPVSDEDHFVIGHKDFTFAASYASGTPLEVMAKSVYSKSSVKLVASYVSDGVYEYTLHQVVQPWNIYFGSNPDTEAGGVGNDGIHTQRVWSHMNILYVNVEKEDVVSIYNMTGVLYKKLEIPAGLKTLTLERGIYVVTLKDGSVHKIVIK
ncbi:MAG: T9SS type A sorting domain-containing protein, partial [Tannerella sp.]|nr:T9SS type A sorting domain-containing protein [Tannerella sp.]